MLEHLLLLSDQWRVVMVTPEERLATTVIMVQAAVWAVVLMVLVVKVLAVMAAVMAVVAVMAVMAVVMVLLLNTTLAM